MHCNNFIAIEIFESMKFSVCHCEDGCTDKKKLYKERVATVDLDHSSCFKDLKI